MTPLREPPPLRPRRMGCVVATTGGVATVAGLRAEVGDACTLRAPGGAARRGEVLALRDGHALLWVEDGLHGLGPTTRVQVEPDAAQFPVGDALLGRVLDAHGAPLDGRPPPRCTQRRPVQATSPAPMSRRRIARPFATGVRAIDGLCTLGLGQRVAIMAPAGVGKSTLLGMMARRADSEVNVIALVGERGREVREFVEDVLGPAALARSVVVCATSDRSPLARLRAPLAATAVAEHFRDQGRQVLLVVDSLTRFARAQRELGLAQGEMPTRRGYPASLFAALPALLERAGPGPEGTADITAVYTVLMEDDETADPVAEEVKSLLDGHLVLSRAVAAGGRYPAIDVRASISRLMTLLVDADAQEDARRVRALLERHAELQPLVQMGEYREGHDPLADAAMRLHAPLRDWLAQRLDEHSDADDARWRLRELLAGVPA